jgi:hypothetical protein
MRGLEIPTRPSGRVAVAVRSRRCLAHVRMGEGGGDAVVVADGAADPHQAAPDRPGIAFTYVTDGGLTSPLELKRYRLFHARLGSISSEPFAREKQK